MVQIVQAVNVARDNAVKDVFREVFVKPEIPLPIAVRLVLRVRVARHLKPARAIFALAAVPREVRDAKR